MRAQRCTPVIPPKNLDFGRGEQPNTAQLKKGREVIEGIDVGRMLVKASEMAKVKVEVENGGE